MIKMKRLSFIKSISICRITLSGVWWSNSILSNYTIDRNVCKYFCRKNVYKSKYRQNKVIRSFVVHHSKFLAIKLYYKISYGPIHGLVPSHHHIHGSVSSHHHIHGSVLSFAGLSFIFHIRPTHTSCW